MSEVLRYFMAFLVFALLVTVYIGSYLLNKKTKKPEGCVDATSGCASCGVVTCSLNSAHDEEN